MGGRFHRNVHGKFRFAFMDINPLFGMTLQPGNAFFEKYKLSDREREVLIELLKDLHIKEIGEKLFISENNVKTHQKNIYLKLGISSKKELLKMLKTEIVGNRGYETMLFSILADQV